uniref:ATP-dependent metallopeptidase FtsH/Yme1/Tma family protein n=1 Tax=Bdellovibrio bacteriovorus TaxID=959 RepID=UPI00403DDC2B
MRSTQKTLALWFFLIIMAVFLFQAYESKHQRVISDFNYPKFSDAVKAGEVASVTFRQDTSEIVGELKPEFEKKNITELILRLSETQAIRVLRFFKSTASLQITSVLIVAVSFKHLS